MEEVDVGVDVTREKEKLEKSRKLCWKNICEKLSVSVRNCGV